MDQGLVDCLRKMAEADSKQTDGDGSGGPIRVEQGKFIRLCPHKDFFQKAHNAHGYVKMIYMCEGKSFHRIDEAEIMLSEGEILFVNQYAGHEVYPSKEESVGALCVILPEFFRVSFEKMGEDENLLRDHLAQCLCTEDGRCGFLHFQVADVLPVQNLMENLMWTMIHDPFGSGAVGQITLGLLFMQLMHHTDRISYPREYLDRKLMFQVLAYIDRNYKDGELTELCTMLGYDIYWLSRVIKKRLGKTYKELLQIKRLSQAAFLLVNTRLPVMDISLAVGYDNTSYFHRIFKEHYEMSPREYRESINGLPVS